MNKANAKPLFGYVLKGVLITLSFLVYPASWGFTPLSLLAPPVLLVLAVVLFTRGAKKTAIVISYWALATFFMGPMLSPFDRLYIWALAFGLILMALLFTKSMTESREARMENTTRG